MMATEKTERMQGFNSAFSHREVFMTFNLKKKSLQFFTAQPLESSMQFFFLQPAAGRLAEKPEQDLKKIHISAVFCLHLFWPKDLPDYPKDNNGLAGAAKLSTPCCRVFSKMQCCTMSILLVVVFFCCCCFCLCMTLARHRSNLPTYFLMVHLANH